MAKAEFEFSKDCGELFYDLDAGADDFGANAIAGDGGYIVDLTDIMDGTW